jgi:hypothetical protein
MRRPWFTRVGRAVLQLKRTSALKELKELSQKGLRAITQI